MFETESKNLHCRKWSYDYLFLCFTKTWFRAQIYVKEATSPSSQFYLS